MSKPLNDNEVFQRKTPVSMGELAAVRMRIVSEKQRHAETEERIDVGADRLVKIFNAPGSRAFYCDCIRHLSQDYVERAIESAFRPRIKNPAAYFGRICTNALVKLGVYH